MSAFFLSWPFWRKPLFFRGSVQSSAFRRAGSCSRHERARCLCCRKCVNTHRQLYHQYRVGFINSKMYVMRRNCNPAAEGWFLDLRSLFLLVYKTASDTLNTRAWFRKNLNQEQRMVGSSLPTYLNLLVLWMNVEIGLLGCLCETSTARDSVVTLQFLRLAEKKSPPSAGPQLLARTVLLYLYLIALLSSNPSVWNCVRVWWAFDLCPEWCVNMAGDNRQQA